MIKKRTLFISDFTEEQFYLDFISRLSKDTSEEIENEGQFEKIYELRPDPMHFNIQINETACQTYSQTNKRSKCLAKKKNKYLVIIQNNKMIKKLKKNIVSGFSSDLKA